MIHRLPGGGIVFDRKLARELYNEFFGNPLGLRKRPRKKPFNRPLVLDVYETLYLAETRGFKVILGDKALSLEELKASYDYNEAVYIVYKELRNKGYIVRSGMRFGADFLVYTEGPDVEHAPYAVIVSKSPTGLDLIRVSRLTHSVRKEALLAIVAGENVTFYRVRRFKELKRILDDLRSLRKAA